MNRSVAVPSLEGIDTRCRWPADVVLSQRRTPCLSRLDALGWTPNFAVVSGRRLVGVRANDERAAELVRERLSGGLRPDSDLQVVPNFSVQLADRAARPGPMRGLNLVYADHEVVARRHRAGELLDDLAAIVAAAGHDLEADRMAVGGTLVAAPNRGAVLLPPYCHSRMLPLQRRLRKRGWRLSPARSHLLDVTEGQVFVAADADDAEAAATVRTWLLATGIDCGRLEPVQPAQGVQHAFFTVRNPVSFGAGRALALLADAANRTQFATLPFLDGRELVDLLDTLG